MRDAPSPDPGQPGSAGNLHLYTGNGKGKTTAAVGLAVRSAGWGHTLLFAQFLKDASDPSGEVAVLSGLPGVTVVRGDVPVPSFAAATPSDRESVTASVRALAERLRPMLAQRRDLVVLDELTVALALSCLTETEGRALVRLARENARDVVVTGRDAPAWLVASADLVTEMHLVRHPYDSGHPGREGIEW